MYYQRLIEDAIALKLKSSGAVLVAGPKFCGKTTTCMLYQKSFVKWDNAGLECDAVVHLEDGRWGGVEIKLGGDDLINEGAESLKTLREKIVKKSDEKAPSFLLVLTAVGGAYKREDGVFVAPINLLKP